MWALEPVLEDAASLSRIGVDGPLARTVVKCADDLPQARADKLQLKQVIVNLVRNAHEALADTPTPLIEVSARVAPENAALIEIAVSDNGPGLELEEDESPFDAFNSTKATGMGLGWPSVAPLSRHMADTSRSTQPLAKGHAFRLLCRELTRTMQNE